MSSLITSLVRPSARRTAPVNAAGFTPDVQAALDSYAREDAAATLKMLSDLGPSDTERFPRFGEDHLAGGIDRRFYAQSVGMHAVR